jgi:pyrroloquinoline quinone (PQQ) biosynthesis protein C
MAVAQESREVLSPDDLMDALEQIRSDFTGGDPAGARRRPPQSPEQVVEEKRRFHLGGDGNHRFEGERYLNIRDDKDVRRFQLRKLIDEGGQDSVGGPVPSHPTLQRWHSLEFGIPEDEINHREMEDALPEVLVRNGWWYYMHRTEPWPVLLGSALVSEGAKRVPAIREAQLRDLDEVRELYESWGIKDIERAMKNQVEHSPIGADDDHVIFGENMTREHVNTPELQESVRKVFTLRIQQPKA